MLKTKELKVLSFTADLETEAHRGEATCPSSSKQERVELRLAPAPSNLA